MSEFGEVSEINPEPRAGTPVAQVGEDRVWAAIAHAGSVIFGFVAPLLVMITRGAPSPWVREQAVEALNFQITVLLALGASALLAVAFIGALTGPLITLFAFVLALLAGYKAWKGEEFRYPLVWRLVK